jgi:hypothetical protein
VFAAGHVKDTQMFTQKSLASYHLAWRLHHIDSLHPLGYPATVYVLKDTIQGIPHTKVYRKSAKVARGVIRDWTSRKHEEHWQSIRGQKQAKGFLKKPSARKADELLNLSRNQLKIMTGLLTGHCHLKGHLFKLGLVNSPECNRCKQASETASHVVCDCEALATLRFRHLGHHFMKPGDF